MDSCHRSSSRRFQWSSSWCRHSLESFANRQALSRHFRSPRAQSLSWLSSQWQNVALHFCIVIQVSLLSFFSACQLSKCPGSHCSLLLENTLTRPPLELLLHISVPDAYTLYGKSKMVQKPVAGQVFSCSNLSHILWLCRHTKQAEVAYPFAVRGLGAELVDAICLKASLSLEMWFTGPASMHSELMRHKSVLASPYVFQVDR